MLLFVLTVVVNQRICSQQDSTYFKYEFRIAPIQGFIKALNYNYEFYIKENRSFVLENEIKLSSIVDLALILELQYRYYFFSKNELGRSKISKIDLYFGPAIKSGIYRDDYIPFNYRVKFFTGIKNVILDKFTADLNIGITYNISSTYSNDYHFPGESWWNNKFNPIGNFTLGFKF